MTEKDTREDLKKKLTPLQFHVTQQCGTEPPFNNQFWNNKKPGIYVDVVSGEPLFSSLDKFDSGTGWPSFTRPIKEENVLEKPDHSYGIERVEVRILKGDSHLCHLFEDGAEADRPALLHQLRIFALYPGRGSGKGGIRTVLQALC